MNREGSAEEGVSFSRNGYVCIAPLPSIGFEARGARAGPAKGFVGPVAPALSMPPAEVGDLTLGEGGGSTKLLESPRARV